MAHRVLNIHASYQFSGGEDSVVASETRLLRNAGCKVVTYVASNGDLIAQGRLSAVKALLHSDFNRESYDRVRAFCRETQPDVAHVHNFWFALSPSVHAACHAEGVPTVQTLHNFRLICLNAILMRKGQPCERCVGRSPWPGVFRGCYRGSIAQSAAVARMILKNRRRGTWENDVDSFVALTKFNLNILLKAGFPQDKLRVKPNFVEDPGPVDPPGKGAIFLGRLSEEKGVRTLINAWIHSDKVQLRLIGNGPLSEELSTSARKLGLERVLFEGRQSAETCLQGLHDAAFLVLPSNCYEGFPRALAEAFALGRPVIASAHGSLAELVENGRNGLLFEPGNAEDLAEKVRWMAEHPEACREMGLNARREYEQKYTPERNYEMLMEIYEAAIRNYRNRVVR